MLFSLLAPLLTEVGAPLLKNLITKHLGGAAGDVGGAVVDAIADKVGVEANPQAISDAYQADPAGVGEAIRQVEIERREDWAAMLAEVNQTMRAEQKAKDKLTRIWRPLFGIEFGLVYSALGAAFVYAIAAAESPINAVGQIGGYLSTYLGFGASVLGVYVWQRSQEKRNGKA
ncbi:3TM-type holin [Breoghania sp.]|uniref:3TM-type holin n=1 Tax=Breoghania sp. TaxID=2065378 RepID=UPI002AA644F0|nr:3TM-type holin [Breoghania sp.]